MIIGPERSGQVIDGRGATLEGSATSDAMVVVSPAGVACIIADGSAWSILEPAGRKS